MTRLTLVFAIERLKPTTVGRLILWFITSLAFLVAGVQFAHICALKSYPIEQVFTFAAGFLVSFALTSYGLESVEQQRRLALSRFWEPFANENTYLILPSCEESGIQRDDVHIRDPVLSYHDAVAGYEMVSFLFETFGSAPTIVPS